MLKVTLDIRWAAPAAIMLALAIPVEGCLKAAVSDKLTNEDRILLGEVLKANEADDCATVVKLLRPRLARKEPIKPDAVAVYAYEMTANCLARENKSKEARRLAYIGTPMSDASDQFWNLRLFLEMRDGDYPAAVATVEALNNGRGKTLNGAPISWLYDLTRGLSQTRLEKEQERLLAILSAPAYSPADPMATKDGFRARYVQLLQKSGRRGEAAEVAKDIESSRILLSLSADPRSRAIVPKDFDARAATEGELERATRMARLHDDLLQPITEASHSLRLLGRSEESLSLLRAAGTRPGGLAAYKDADERLSWWWDALGRTYMQLGMYEPMVDAFRQGANFKERGNINVSQAINLVSAQIEFGKPEDALKVMDELKLSDRPMSPFGTMQMRYARGCASALAGRKEQADADLVYMRAHEKDDPNALAELMMCMENFDGAAALFIRMLADPERTGELLLRFSDYDAPPRSAPVSPVAAGVRILRERQDIREAITRAGGALRVHLQEDSFL